MIWLAFIAVVEAVVYQSRYRSAVVGGPFSAAWWTLATQALRVVWLAIGVGELMRGSDLVYVIAAYGLPAAATVGVMRAIEQRREGQGKPSLGDFISSHERADAEKNTA